ncbi:hypothetical protein J3459_011242 [Metarhizium acridum]|nr:hypothetical protein J3459_011242 [Metarhizium acridum]
MAACTQTQVALAPSVTLNTGDTTQRQLSETSSASQPSDSFDEAPQMPLFRKVAVITQLSGVNFASSAVNGLVVVSLPTITAAIKLDPSLAFWPTSVSNLANASTILLAGSVADSIGPRTVNLAGGIVTGAFILAAGACKTGPQLVVMRALQGVGYAMHLASSVAIVTSTLPRGRPRNFAFSCLGLSQPLGFSFGLVLRGRSSRSPWLESRLVHYGSLTLVLSAVATWALPKSHYERTFRGTLRNFKERVDWVGALLASTFMALLSYLFA